MGKSKVAVSPSKVLMGKGTASEAALPKQDLLSSAGMGPMP